MTKLSPASLAVWEAFNQEKAGVFVDYKAGVFVDYSDKLAAALRAVADQVVPDESDSWTRDLSVDAWIRWAERKRIRRDILDIVNELQA